MANRFDSDPRLDSRLQLKRHGLPNPFGAAFDLDELRQQVLNLYVEQGVVAQAPNAPVVPPVVVQQAPPAAPVVPDAPPVVPPIVVPQDQPEQDEESLPFEIVNEDAQIDLPSPEILRAADLDNLEEIPEIFDEFLLPEILDELPQIVQQPIQHVQAPIEDPPWAGFDISSDEDADHLVVHDETEDQSTRTSKCMAILCGLCLMVGNWRKKKREEEAAIFGRATDRLLEAQVTFGFNDDVFEGGKKLLSKSIDKCKMFLVSEGEYNIGRFLELDLRMRF